MIGKIIAIGFGWAPVNFIQCSGQSLAISSYTSLFSLIGTTFGGDGRSTFAVPDLRGRTGIGRGEGPGLEERFMGQYIGYETVTLDSTTLPTHTHSGDTLTISLAGLSVDLSHVTGTQHTSNLPGDSDHASGAYFAATVGIDLFTEDSSSAVPMKAGTIVLSGDAPVSGSAAVAGNVALAGANRPFGIIQPSLVINYCICTQGVYPSRP
ncbi:MAG: tail fiber protein [Balneolales bacterium]|nr:tail fiber protein [Balneolales bacterium]